jgi:8-oxo-dGTP diphosphatase
LLVADGDRPREGGPDRKEVEVAVGVLMRADGAFLLTAAARQGLRRLLGIPGGKVEARRDRRAGAAPRTAGGDRRHIGAVHPWRVERVDYPHALVRLNFCKVFEWQGELHMHEGQQFAWQQLPVACSRCCRARCRCCSGSRRSAASGRDARRLALLQLRVAERLVVRRRFSSGTRKLSLAQAPRSMFLQRSLQNGRYGLDGA